MYRGCTQTDYQNKHYNINQKDEGTWDDRGRDGGTNIVLRIKKQETLLILHEHDYNDDDSSDGTVSSLKKEDRYLVTRFPRVARDLSLLHNFQNRYPAQQASYPVVSDNNSGRT